MIDVLLGVASAMDMLASIELPVSYGDACWIVVAGIVGMIVIGR